MSFIKKITQTELFKISSLNSVSVLIKIGIGLIASKLLALFVGPTGMALVGNFRNFIATLESVSTLGFQSGIVKFIAEKKNDEESLKKIIATVFITLAGFAILLSGFLYFFASFWNEMLFGVHFKYAFVIQVLAVALPWYAISVFLLSILNGLEEFKKVIWLAIIGNIIGLLVSLILVVQYKTLGALLSSVISPALLFFATFYLVNKKISFFTIIRFYNYDFKIIKSLASYSLMVLVSSVFGSMVFLAIRNNIIRNVGLEQAGYLETMIRISSYYLLFISTLLGVYYLPKLVLANNNQDTKKVFWSYYKNILPPFCFALLILYVMRFFIIKLLFTSQFLPVASLFFWQLLGDVFKAAALILGYQFFAKKITLAFIVSELFSLALLYFSSNYLLTIYGIQGAVMAQAFDNFMYLLVLLFYFRKKIF